MSRTPFPGMLVGSNVHLERQLGSGGQGSIWAATHLGLQIRVAVKFLAPELASQAEARARFEREAAAAAQLKNPHVVQVFDRGVTDQGLPYIVMELLTGEDLNRRIERLGPRPAVEVAAIITQVARALSSAHAQGVVHRDIKPENVFLIATDGEIFVKLLDFGIAKRTEDKVLSMTSANIMLGTPYFMSPEQVTSTKDVDFRTDLWSVGVVAYTALTAKLPFEGDTLGAVCIAINSGKFEPVTVRQPLLPAALDVWFERAFQLDPKRRFASMHEMATAFEVAVGVSAARAPAHAASTAPPPLSSDRSSPALFRVPTENRFDSILTRPTFAGAAITQGDPPKQNQLLMVLAVVLTSAVSSALTTVLFLAPASFDGVTRVFTGSPPEPAATSSVAPLPSASANVLPTPPRDPAAPGSASAAPEIQANTPETPRTAPRKTTPLAPAPRPTPTPEPEPEPEPEIEPPAPSPPADNGRDYGL